MQILLLPIIIILLSLSPGRPTTHRSSGPITLSWDRYIPGKKTVWGIEYCDNGKIKTKTWKLMEAEYWAIKTENCLIIKD
jgi:hypothetical protein